MALTRLPQTNRGVLAATYTACFIAIPLLMSTHRCSKYCLHSRSGDTTDNGNFRVSEFRNLPPSPVTFRTGTPTSLLPPPGWVQNSVMVTFVCLSACLSARITRKPQDRTSLYFFCAGWLLSPSSSVAIRYVFPVFWTSSCFHNCPMARQVYFEAA